MITGLNMRASDKTLKKRVGLGKELKVQTTKEEIRKFDIIKI